MFNSFFKIKWITLLRILKLKLQLKIIIYIGGIHMSSAAQRAELQSQIWKIANDVRGSVDGWDFKQYVLGTLFYRFISENFSNYIEGGDDSVNYEKLNDINYNERN